MRYENDMRSVFAAADLVVCRAGASTVAELAVAGVPSVLVPLPGAPGDHQTANARAMVDAGAAVLVPDADLDAPRLGHEVDALVGNRGRLASMHDAALGLARPDAATAVARLSMIAGIGLIGGGQTALLLPAQIVMTLAWSAIFLGERMTSWQGLGAALVMTSILLAKASRGRGSPTNQPELASEP